MKNEKIIIGITELSHTELCRYINNLKIKDTEKQQLFKLAADFCETTVNSYVEELQKQK